VIQSRTFLPMNKQTMLTRK